MATKKVILVVKIEVPDHQCLNLSGRAINQTNAFAALTKLITGELDGRRKSLICRPEYKDLWSLVQMMIADGKKIADHLSETQIFEMVKLMLEAGLTKESGTSRF